MPPISFCLSPSPVCMYQNNFIPNEIDDPIYLSKFPNAHVKNKEIDSNLKYENMIFESAFNDYISIIKGSKFKRINEENEYNIEGNYKYLK